MAPERASAASVVHDVLDLLWPGRFGDSATLRDGEPLGADGLGLDSIEIVELVLECQSRAGLAAERADDLLDSGQLTIGGLIEHLARA